MITWIVLIGWFTKLVLVLLFALSVWSVKIMRERQRFFKDLEVSTNVTQYREFVQNENWPQLSQLLQQAKPHDLFAGTLRTALKANAQSEQAAELAVKSYLALEKTQMEKGLTVLATLGANAPFVGLFGTVLGIIQAFGVLSGQQGAGGGASSVMSSISEALVATAVGLFVAIPAVVAYNYFQRRLKTVLVECESLRDCYLSKLVLGKVDFNRLLQNGN